MAAFDSRSDTFRTASSLSNVMWIALIVVVALIIGGFFWVSRDRSTASNAPPVTAPSTHAVAPPAALPAPATTTK